MTCFRTPAQRRASAALPFLSWWQIIVWRWPLSSATEWLHFLAAARLYYWWFSNDITRVTLPNRGRWHYIEQVIWACWKGFATKSRHARKLETFCNKHLYRLSQPPLQLFLLPFPALTFSLLHVYSLFFSLGRHKYWVSSGSLLWYLYRVCTCRRCRRKHCLFIIPSMRRWPTSQVDFRGLFDNGDLLLWSRSTASLPTMGALLCKNQYGASSHLLHFLPVSLVISLWSPPNNTPHPLPSVYLSFKKSLQPESSFFILWHAFLVLYYYVRVFLVLIVSLPLFHSVLI